MKVEVELSALPPNIVISLVYEKLLSLEQMMSEIKRESGETSAKVDELLNEAGNTVNRLLAINAEKDTLIEQLRAGELDATEAAAEQDRLQTKIDDEIATLRQIGVTNIQNNPTPVDQPPTGEDETPPQ